MKTTGATPLRQQTFAMGDATMKAIAQTQYGSPDVLRLADLPKPAIAADEVLIRVRAAAVNHADWVLLTGTPLIGRLAFGVRAPRQPVRGRDVAGEVEAVGDKVTRVRPGDEVYAEVDTGSFAEYTRATESAVFRMPAGLNFEEAAAVPVSARTALQGLLHVAQVRPGHRVLINGASGGVGTFAVQIATALGAEVTGVCSLRNADLVRSLGAVHVIDYARKDFTRGGEHYDVIFDSIGNHSLLRLRGSLTRTGTLVLSSGTGGRMLGPMGRILRSLLLSPFISQNLRSFAKTKATLADVTAFIESGQVRPVIDRTYPLSQTRQALDYFADQHARAKIVISVSTGRQILSGQARERSSKPAAPSATSPAPRSSPPR
jgi:NADPH:quinone reductase-like Zn-dependent oxidoreductase